MTSAVLSQFSKETRLLGYLYPAAIIFGIGSAFVTTHTDLKIVTTVPRLVPSPATKPILPPEHTIFEFGFPAPPPGPVKPVLDPVAQLSTQPVVTTKAAPALMTDTSADTTTDASAPATTVSGIRLADLLFGAVLLPRFAETYAELGKYEILALETESRRQVYQSLSVPEPPLKLSSLEPYQSKPRNSAISVLSGGRCNTVQARCAVEIGGVCNPQTGKWAFGKWEGKEYGGNTLRFNDCIGRNYAKR
jgi:hypothetical protein